MEIVPEAIESAKANAARMGADVAAKSRFFCADAGQAATRLAAEGLHPDIVMLDPPRKAATKPPFPLSCACLPAGWSTSVATPPPPQEMLHGWNKNGYHAEKVQPVDLFPRTRRCETIVLLSKGEVDSKKIRVEFSLEDMDMSEFQDGATYPQIKEYVLEHTGLKVSNLYISQIKRKCGIGVGKNYNLPKSEDSRQPQCPQEKEKAIREAFKYFGMI